MKYVVHTTSTKCCDDVASATESAAGAGAPEIRRKIDDKIKLTIDSISAGVDAYNSWDSNKEYVELLVVEVFYKMLEKCNLTKL